MYQWIEYSLIERDGQGIQPYEILVPLGVDFEGGHYVENGRYRGKLAGTPDQITNAMDAMRDFSPVALSDVEIVTIAEIEFPVDTEIRHLPTESIRYIGPPTLDANSNIVRPMSTTKFKK